MHLKLGEVSTIVVSSAEFAKEVMKTHDVIFASRPHILANSILTYGDTNIGFAPYGDYWRQLRKICTLELLSMKRVQSFRSLREEEVLNLINLIRLRAETPINITEQIYSFTYGFTSRAAFGIKSKDQDKFIDIVKQAMKVAGGFDVADIFPSVSLLHLIKHKKDMATSESHDVEAREDLIDVLLKFHEEESGLEFSLTADNVKAIILETFGAGGETAATTVNWAISEMIKNPRIMQKAQAEVREVFNTKGQVDETGIKEMIFLNLVIKETLRLHPPFPLLLPRECRESLVINAWAIGRDPNYWTNPDSFYPERFLDSSIDLKGKNFEFIPFGAGRRMCPGMSFGLASVEFPLASLLYHFDWKLSNGMKHDEDLDMTEAFGVSVRRKQDLHLIPIPYHPPPTGK
ncbi:premnaspirodiene oxygenase-like [Pyrus ussuriensis x Pyrus communis]|uniref:Premnaspirodiene oxygenase-like n=1 Tax=Pyrus ussuriensis x Pyrus communis TaxID=2448454 RepID=A0A5N5FWX0_9ROSA|nr:premnaspirodiene oxygenase-like [Pyrus ussuriensis x Pyrus communis]